MLTYSLEDRGGVLFNGRRVSRDRLQQMDLLRLCGGRLWVTPASAALFAGAEDCIAVDPDCLEKAEAGAYCFWEGAWPEQSAKRIEGIVLYRWNRAYPADLYFPLDWEARGFALTERTEFTGSSHERITRERYQRRSGHDETKDAETKNI